MKKFTITLALVFGLICGFPAIGPGAEKPVSPAPAPSLTEAAVRAAAEKGDPAAQYELGLALVKPIPPHFGPVKEGAEAVIWLEKSAGQGNMDAAFLLGYIYQYGTGVAKDVGKSVAWLTKAADAGNESAMITLAATYKVGDGVMKDKVKARNLYAKAAEKGNNNARTALATMYMDGDGVHKDGKLALAWFTRAVKDGHAPAMLGLGNLYAKKDLGLLNGPKALYWTHRAVAGGYVPAVYALGLLYRDGVGTVAPDAYQAYLWLGLTFELSGPHTEMPYWFENAARVLSPEQKKKADDEIDVWLKKGPPAPPAKEPQ
ncbi:putative Beta-lactamase [uncultured delta proteobacterium]|uniref:Putative Beta-lactamase n=1 Tax=uncultured delta proteobacterium TaxID=34034 RepID=A0A212J006_9DELT|nr:putative Beta-lactamase [uncultured delta proteobacterium]